MNCPQCSGNNPEGARFCMECGFELAVTCPQCGATLPSRAKFCLECGAPVGATQQRVQPSGQDAVSALERAVQADPSFHYVYLALAQILASLSKSDRARECLERLLALEEVSEDVRVPAQDLLARLRPSPRPAEHA